VLSMKIVSLVLLKEDRSLSNSNSRTSKRNHNSKDTSTQGGSYG